MSRPVLLPRALEPSPGQARDWLREELARPAYHHQASLVQRLADWLQEQWHRLLDQSQAAAGWSPLVTAVVAAAVVALLAFVLPRVRRERRLPGRGAAVLTDPRTTAAMYRARVAAALAEGRFDDALADAYRALTREAADRTLLEDTPGSTAHEVALALAPRFPDEVDALRRAADLFDAVRYGERHLGRADAEEVVGLDARLTRTRPVLTSADPAVATP
ncbi:DUF4129 domain-containing protein [Oryzihumus leptocrescens]|uniref:Uncharacterized protein DUF4129 n=1 Tax=Oryzihumus leptocrescens TaxID=297536 RepID=A0A542ZGE5_9MICO|nr:DUF4129 domain-containing protein [Oryzihumus leptocrescens]TQL59270.1 uncharacterized protein DUF4129 [Oryzihumus leptocrescens]